MGKWLGILAIGIAAILIGCGGDAPEDNVTGTTSTTQTTNGTTNGGTTGDFTSVAGYYRGTLEGSNTTGARFSGEGGATIDADGGAFFAFNAIIGGASYYREFDGSIDSSGRFSGYTHTGEPASGTVTFGSGSLSATIVWQKRTATGQIFYTETENFSLTRSQG